MSENNLKLPEDLSETKLEESLIKELGNIKVQRVETISASTAGDHNLSDISRIIVHYIQGNEEKSKSFIFKDPKKNSIILELTNGIAKEISWYGKILPEIEKIGVNVGAASYIINKDWLLFQDLTVEGYKVLDRKAMLDLEHCFQAVKVLAKFHAVTNHLYETNNLPEIAMKDHTFIPSNEFFFEISKKYDMIINNLNEMGHPEYSEVIDNLKYVSWSKMQECAEENQDFLCLVQGDYWTTNILFKYDLNEKVSDAKIIDFQMIRLATPAYDLHFFVCTSIKPEVRDNHLDEIYKVYLEALNKTLNKISTKSTMSQEQFGKMMKGTEFMGIFTTLTFLPVVLCESPLQFLPPEHLSEEEKKNYNSFDVVYQQKTYSEHLLSLLDFYKRTNVI